MDFVDDIYSVFCSSRGEPSFFPQSADAVYTIVAGGVDLNYIHYGVVVNSLADFAGTAGIAVFGTKAVYRFCKDSGAGGFPSATGSGKQIRVGHTAGLQLMLQGDCDLRLPNNF